MHQFVLSLLDNSFLEDVMENIPVGIFAKNASDDFRFVIWNKEMENIFGNHRSEMLGKTDYDFFEKEEADYYRQYDISIMNQNEVVDIPLEEVSTSKGEILAHTTKVPVTLKNEDRLLVGIISDITESENNKKKLKELLNQKTKYVKELKIEKKKVEEAVRAKEDFLANMSHEIRTPMNGILGFVENLAKGETDPKRLEKFQVVKTSGQSLMTIINDILDFSKIESGKMSVESQPYNLHQLLESSISLYSQSTSEKDITLENNMSSIVPKYVVGDQTRIRQVIYNLLSNAIKFTPEHGIVTLESSLIDDMGKMYIAVTDTGVGIAQDNLEKIFEAFSQEDISTTRKYGGTGLGLSISAKLVSMMGGSLKVQSTLGKGSKFYFEIPVTICDEPLFEDADTSAMNESVNSLFDAHLLIAEDNKTNQLLISMILDEHGISYEIADDGLEAVSMFKNNQYDAILMDENMPNMNGIEATQKIREIEKEQSLKKIPIIAVTANALIEDRQRFLDGGMDDYLSKPYTEDQVLEILDKYLVSK